MRRHASADRGVSWHRLYTIPNDLEEVKTHVIALFSGFESIDRAPVMIEELERDIRRGKTWVAEAPEILSERGLAFQESSVQSCYIDSSLQREVLEAGVERASAHDRA